MANSLQRDNGRNNDITSISHEDNAPSSLPIILKNGHSSITAFSSLDTMKFSKIPDIIKLENKVVSLVNPVKEKYICRLCNELLHNPIQTLRGELACKVCYESKQHEPSMDGKCPIDGEPIDQKDIFPDKSMMREINKLQCVCLFQKDGCTWIGALGDINTHEAACEYRPLTCESCGQDTSHHLLQEHQQRDCINRCTPCPYCQNRIPISSITVHKDTCSEKPFGCPFKCKVDVKRGEMYIHAQHCENIRNSTVCPYSAFGCTFEHVEEKTLSMHISADNVRHIGLVFDKMNTMKETNYDLKSKLDEERKSRENLEKEMKSMEKKMNAMSEQHEAQMKRLNESTSGAFGSIQPDVLKSSLDVGFGRLKTLEGNFADLHTKGEESYENLLTMQTQINNMVPGKDFSKYLQHIKDLEQLKEQVDRLETQQAQSMSRISDAELNLQLVENTTFTGRLIWKIDNFAYRTRQAEIGKVTVLHSAPCYTNRFEYKFCSRLYLNGDGVGKCEYLSLFICVMKSQLDDQLKWPLEKKISFRLIHPTDTSKSRTEWFNTDKNSSSFKKPVKEMNIAAGCPKFIKKEDVIREGFVVNDSIYIETLVE